MFLRNWTPPDPEMFEELISVEVEDDPKTCLSKVVDGLVRAMVLVKPSDAAMDDALKAAESYRINGAYQQPKQQLAKPIRYYALAPEVNTRQLMANILASNTSESAKIMYETLSSDKRIIDNAHITICHEAEVEEDPAGTSGAIQTLWTQCQTLAKKGSPYHFEASHLIWDDRVMCLALRLVTSSSNGELAVPTDIQRQLHITIGTISDEVRTRESIKLVRAMRSALDDDKSTTSTAEVVEGGGTVKWIELQGIEGEGRIRGMW